MRQLVGSLSTIFINFYKFALLHPFLAIAKTGIIFSKELEIVRMENRWSNERQGERENAGRRLRQHNNSCPHEFEGMNFEQERGNYLRKDRDRDGNDGAYEDADRELPMP